MGGHIQMPRKPEDLTNQQFNEWTALEYAGDRMWKCRCSCGKIGYVNSGKLKGGYSKSCGHKNSQFIDLKGKQFGELTALEYVGNRKWRCQCSCGSIKDYATYALTSGHTKSCGHNSGVLKDMKGKVVNGILFIEYIGDGEWVCKCHCGKLFVALGRAVRYGKIKSCGCSQGNNAYEDLKDKQFGEWKVLEYAGDSTWKCQCSCGTISNVNAYTLKSGKSTKCNSPLHRLNNLKGQTFGELTVDSYIGNGIYRCKCSCGNYKNVLGANLKNGSTKSCGCKWNGVSHYEEEIVDWLKTITNSQIITSDRKVLKGKELDIYIPEKHIAIEFNGNFWHSDIYKDKYYHQQKTFECAKQGIRLIHIFEYEWLDDDKKEKIKNIIASKISDNTVELDANNTEIKIVTKEEAESFLNKYHLNGCCNFDIDLGLYYKDKLTMIMTFGLLDDKYEILRECAKDNIKVIGGTQKLVSYFIEKYKPAYIVKYISIDKFTGNNYLKIGFKNNEIIEPEDIWISTNNNTDDDENWILLHDCGKIKLKYREDKTC